MRRSLAPALLVGLLAQCSCARFGFEPMPQDAGGRPDGQRDTAPPDATRDDRDARGSEGLPPDGAGDAGSDATVLSQWVLPDGLSLAPVTSTQHAGPLWDLTRCDLQLSYTIDLAGMTSPVPQQLQAQVGLRQEGAADYSPDDDGGWMTHIPAEYVDTEPLAFDMDDKIDLSSTLDDDERDYDVNPSGMVIPPFGTQMSKGIWFDRDGVNDAGCPTDGSSFDDYCSGGRYRVVIDYRALEPQLGTMFATVNGVATGFFTDGWRPGDPDITPAGRSFHGDMTRMQLFVGLSALFGTGTVEVTEVEIRGCQR